jgi:hypothetical protein
MTECFFANFGWGPCRMRFDGNFDPAHLIPQQRIREAFARRGEPCPDLTDERLIVPACRHHHDLFDRKLRKLSLGDFPPKLLAWAQQHGLYFDPGRNEWRGAAQQERRAA